ncbi:hypothetical protein JVU11DRAFT_11677 [Chiua virens]|nr:hypothetical protein JVU11DRAFT_11677 [Chiua virens]
MTYHLAKVSDDILVPEHFAFHLGTHVLSKYAHLQNAFVTIEQLRWSRITVSGRDKPHTHAFHRDDKRIVRAIVGKTNGKTLLAKVTAGIGDLLMFKSTGYAFERYCDEYTTLVEVSDRILSTSIDLEYRFTPVWIPVQRTRSCSNSTSLIGPMDRSVAERAGTSMVDLLTTDEKCKCAGDCCSRWESECVEEVTYKLPNKHYIPVEMKYLGLDNLTPSEIRFLARIGYLIPFVVAAVKIDDAGGMIERTPLRQPVALRSRHRGTVNGPLTRSARVLPTTLLMEQLSLSVHTAAELINGRTGATVIPWDRGPNLIIATLLSRKTYSRCDALAPLYEGHARYGGASSQRLSSRQTFFLNWVRYCPKRTGAPDCRKWGASWCGGALACILRHADTQCDADPYLQCECGGVRTRGCPQVSAHDAVCSCCPVSDVRHA